MSTNVFPRTQESDVLEKLANVPPGTAIEHAAWCAAMPPHVASFATREEYEADLDAFAAWDAAATQAVHRFHTFRDYGFGRITSPAWQLAKALAERDAGDPNCHEVQTPADVNAMLAAQGAQLPEGITVADLGGIFWS